MSPASNAQVLDACHNRWVRNCRLSPDCEKTAFRTARNEPLFNWRFSSNREKFASPASIATTRSFDPIFDAAYRLQYPLFAPQSMKREQGLSTRFSSLATSSS